MAYIRPYYSLIANRISGPRGLIQVVTGPRKTGKSTLALQLVENFGRSSIYASSDEVVTDRDVWVERQWQRARLATRDAGNGTGVLVLDEIQKIPGWAETVRRLWDEDTQSGLPLKLILLGSSSPLIKRALTETLAGRFEILHLPHWSYAEMKGAFGCSLDQYIYYGGCPGAASLVGDYERWGRYINEHLIETTITRDIFLVSRVDKPGVLKRLFQLGCGHSGEILSYTKMLGRLQDAGNTTTLAHYLDLLAEAGLLMGLQKFVATAVRQRGSSPKLQVMDTALITSQLGLTISEARADPQLWGRLVEAAVGAHLANAAAAGVCELFYWRDRNREVDFVARRGNALTALEVRSGRTRDAWHGGAAFEAAYKPQRTLIVGGEGVDLEEFLARPVESWLS